MTLLNPSINDIIPIKGINMRKLKDLTGFIFGRLTILERTLFEKLKPHWLALCKCGKETICSSRDLISGDKKSCGCLRKDLLREDLINQRFGKLVCVSHGEKRGKAKSQFWNCLCDCGKKTNVSAQHLKNKQVTSCGCLKITSEIAKSYEEEFLKNVEKTESCWNWKGSLSRGYGIFFAGKFIKSHRFSYIIFNDKEIDKSNIICHHCDNPICVNPNHLYSGTHKTNAEDMQRRGKRKKTKSLNVR